MNTIKACAVARIEGAELLVMLADQVSKGAPISKPMRDWFACSVDRWVTSPIGLDEAFGVKPPPGGRRHSTTLRLADRDGAIRYLCSLFAGSRTAKARAAGRAMARYAASAWRLERSLDCSPRAPGTLEDALWRAMRSSDGKPVGAERIRKILVTS